MALNPNGLVYVDETMLRDVESVFSVGADSTHAAGEVSTSQDVPPLIAESLARVAMQHAEGPGPNGNFNRGTETAFNAAASRPIILSL